MQTIVAEKERRKAAVLDSSLGKSFCVQSLEQSVSMFDMQVAKANAVPRRGNPSLLCWRGTDTRLFSKSVPDHILIW